MTEATLSLDKGIDDGYILVESDQELELLCDRWRDCSYLAMDTEFIRTSTFFPHVGLIQVNAGDENYLIDPLAISQWQQFRDLMTDPGIVKIFHSCSEDLQVFMAEMQLVPTPVFDTQIAAAFLNEGFGNSYQALVKHYLDIDLPKGETRSDWLQRPLHEKQCHYAALDVACLPFIYFSQRDMLESQGRLAWLQQECAALLELYSEELAGDFSDYYLNIRGAWQLRGRQLAVLKKLAQWREERARKRDKPRNWIVRDKHLVDIAEQCPVSMEALRDIGELGRNFLRHEGPEVISLINRCLSIPESDWPRPLPRPLDGNAKKRLKNVQRFAEEKARELNLPIEMLIRKRWLIDILQNLLLVEKDQEKFSSVEELLPSELTGWRKPLLMPGLLEAMEKE